MIKHMCFQSGQLLAASWSLTSCQKSKLQWQQCWAQKPNRTTWFSEWTENKLNSVDLKLKFITQIHGPGPIYNSKNEGMKSSCIPKSSISVKDGKGNLSCCSNKLLLDRIWSNAVLGCINRGSSNSNGAMIFVFGTRESTNGICVQFCHLRRILATWNGFREELKNN